MPTSGKGGHAVALATRTEIVLMRNFTYHAAVLIVCIAVGCASAEAEKRVSAADDAPAQLPQSVVKAAADAAPGLEITHAKRLEKRKEIVYRLKGADADGKEYTLTVTEAGEVRQLNASKKKVKPEVAEVNDGPFRKIGSIQNAAIRESSGVVASR